MTDSPSPAASAGPPAIGSQIAEQLRDFAKLLPFNRDLALAIFRECPPYSPDRARRELYDLWREVEGWTRDCGERPPPMPDSVPDEIAYYNAVDLLERYCLGLADRISAPEALPTRPKPSDPVTDRVEAPSADQQRTRGANEDTTLAVSRADASDPTLIALLRVFTNGVADQRFQQASKVLTDDSLNTNDKLTKIDKGIRLPATASAQQLGDMLGVSKQAILKTAWWTENRKGEKADEVGRRRAKHRERAKGYEPPQQEETDELR